MCKNYIAAILLFATIHCAAQSDIKSYVKENTIAVANIQPDSTDFTDLEAIGTAIGSARIVMLGEQDHGDAPTFLAKTRLIQYLHEKKGFNVVVFEADFFALNNGWDNLNKTADNIYPFLKKNITGVWSYCDACQYLFKKVIPQSFNSGNPIQVSGVDNQLALNYSNKNLTRQLDSVLQKLQLPVTKTNNYHTAILPAVDSLTKFLSYTKKSGFYDTAVANLVLVQTEINAAAGSNNFWSMIVTNLIQLANQFKYYPQDEVNYRNIRDGQMANNLKWLCSVKYPGEKIIVWAQNFHVSKNNGNYYSKLLDKYLSMGNKFTNDTAFSNHTYIIGFTSAQGQAGRVGSMPYDVEKPGSNSFENWIGESFNYAFVDFKKFNALNSGRAPRFNMNGSVVYIHKKHDVQWTKIFDGIFYIKNMYPCKIAQ